jgi:hypothetical protein
MTQIWLGFIPAGSTKLVGLDERSEAGGRIYAAARSLISKESSLMSATTAPPVVEATGLSLAKRLVDAAGRAFRWVGGVFVRAAGWVKAGATKVASTLHLQSAWAFTKNMASSFGPVGWWSAGIAMMAHKGGRAFVAKTVNWVIDRATWLVVAPLDLVGLHTAADWVTGVVEKARAQVRRFTKWMGDRGNGRVRRVFDPAGLPMRVTFLGAATIAIAKFWMVLPIPTPIKWLLFGVCWAVVALGLIEDDAETAEAADEAESQDEMDDLLADVMAEAAADAVVEGEILEDSAVHIVVPKDGEPVVTDSSGKPLTAAQLAAEGVKVERTPSNGSSRTRAATSGRPRTRSQRVDRPAKAGAKS